MKIVLGLFFCCIFSLSAAAQISFKTPKAASDALYQAWRTKNRAKAKLVANNSAIDKLFSTRFQPKWKFAGCTDESDTEKGRWQCVYKDASDDLLSVAFDVFKEKRGWRVRTLTFGAEN